MNKTNLLCLEGNRDYFIYGYMLFFHPRLCINKTTVRAGVLHCGEKAAR